MHIENRIDIQKNLSLKWNSADIFQSILFDIALIGKYFRLGFMKK